VDQVVFWCKPC